MVTEQKRTVRELLNAEVKLQRAQANDADFDPVSGFTLDQIIAWLRETKLGLVILRRNSTL